MIKKKSKIDRLKEYPLIEHLTELKKRIVFCIIFFLFSFVLCYSFHNELYNFITNPLVNVLKKYNINNAFIYTGLMENFTSTLSLVFSMSVFVSVPFWLIQIWLFILPALYDNEQRKVFMYFVIIPLCFLFGVLFCYFFILPIVFNFFIGFELFSNRIMPAILQAKITDYIDMTVSFFYIFGFAFLMPILLVFLNKIGFVSNELFVKNRKFVIVGIFIISAILTPPDVLSQIVLAVPLVLMYELVIFLTKNKTK